MKVVETVFQPTAAFLEGFNIGDTQAINCHLVVKACIAARQFFFYFMTSIQSLCL